MATGRLAASATIRRLATVRYRLCKFCVQKPQELIASLRPLDRSLFMDVLIVERDELVRSTLADTLEAEGISATAVGSDEEALNLHRETSPQVVITGINRGHNEDLAGLTMVAAMRRKWPRLCVIYLAALWPACLRHETLAIRERFLPKPFRSPQLIRTVRELLDPGLCCRSG